MVKYTAYPNTRINMKIQKDIELISHSILEILGDLVHSILLCGGFGRGEGSVVFEKETIHIVNDYDFTIVLQEKSRFQYVRFYKQYHAPIEELAVKLASKLDIKQIDLGLKPLSYFSKANVLRIENFEVKKGHVLIFGDEDPTAKMPNWKAEDLPLFEGTWLFRNRGTGMLIAALYFLCTDGIPEEKKENFVIECTKAQLAMGDSILLLKGLYHHLYDERLKRADNLVIADIPLGEEILDNYKEALEHKLRPDFHKFYQRDLTKWWFRISQLMDIFYQYYEQQRLSVKFSNWCDYVSLRKPENCFELKTFIGKTLKGGGQFFSTKQFLANFKKSRRSYSISLIPLLLFSIGTENYDRKMMNKAAQLLGKPASGETKQDWIELAKAALNEIHPGGEVAKAIELHR
jgi:hypothetical protein